MRRSEMQALAHNLLESGHDERGFIEHKRSDQQRDRILKTLRAFANNHMNRGVGLPYAGVREEGVTAFEPLASRDESDLVVLP